MRESLKTKFSTRQYMLSEDFEIYYYSDRCVKKIENHTHSYCEFYLFLEGKVSMVIEGEPISMKKGDVVVIPPGVSHYARVEEPKETYSRFVFWVGSSYLKSLIDQSLSYGYLVRQATENKKYRFHNDVIAFHGIQSKVFRLIEELHSERFGKEEQVTICVRDLLLILNRLGSETENPKRRREGESLYQNLLWYIEEHLGEELSLEKLASVFFLSKYHIAHVFKENTGVSVCQYILKKRLLACKEAMAGEENLTQLCRRLGFQDYSCFYRAFRREFGMSPREYRETMQRTE